ncbi:MAG: Fe-S cluster assembly protein SufD, partial [Myxococcota bacterium]|nr:Fe-S cluster assembly protein SufD [Myxococcota bacterium]
MIDSYRDTHSAFGDEGSQEVSWLRTLRQDALGRFEALGFPGPRVEAWKYTSTRKLAAVPFEHGPVAMDSQVLAQLLEKVPGAKDTPRVVLVNGRVSPEASRLDELPAGVRISSLAEALSDRPEQLQKFLEASLDTDVQPFSALNTAFVQDGALVEISAGTELDVPIHVIHVAASRGRPVVSHPRNLVVLESCARASVVETYLGDGDVACFTNAVTEMVLSEGSRLTHHLCHLDGSANFHVGRVHARVARDASFEQHGFWLGGGWTRNDLEVRFEGPGAYGSLSGLYLLGEEQHLDNHTVLDHAVPHCTSRELFKGVLGGQARGVFNGRVVVARDAQRTDAEQANHNFLLSADADMNTKPELEIYADDVKCAHGTTVGQLDRQQVYYLRSRGIPFLEAQR